MRAQTIRANVRPRLWEEGSMGGLRAKRWMGVHQLQPREQDATNQLPQLRTTETKMRMPTMACQYQCRAVVRELRSAQKAAGNGSGNAKPAVGMRTLCASQRRYDNEVRVDHL